MTLSILISLSEDAGEICSPSRLAEYKKPARQSTAIEKASSSVSPHVAMSRSGKIIEYPESSLMKQAG